MNKEECIRILIDIRDNDMPAWDWDEDYYDSGEEDRVDRIQWAEDRLNKIIEIIEQSELL